MNKFLSIQEEVAAALSDGRPVVALESTIISHGMPWPQNAETAMEVEKAVRDAGAVPATIAILNGKLKVGLDKQDIENLGRTPGVWKVSLRDMPFVVSKNVPGATTVAATMRIAAMAGIKIFATGGIGGVHRGAEKTMDISADLTEMAQTDVAIVSAGIKSILDIGLTLEYLETLGIPVVTYGQDAFPCFYSRTSRYASPLRVDSPSEIASLLKAKWGMGLRGSVLIANPVPEQYAVDADTIEQLIVAALKKAEVRNIIGKDVTPFLLGEIAAISKGESLAANIALIKSNASLAAQIAFLISNNSVSSN